MGEISRSTEPIHVLLHRIVSNRMVSLSHHIVSMRQKNFTLQHCRLYLLFQNLVDFARLRRAKQLSSHLHHVSGWRIQHIDDEPDEIRICGRGSSFHQGRQTCRYVVVVLGNHAIRMPEVVGAVYGIGRCYVAGNDVIVVEVVVGENSGNSHRHGNNKNDDEGRNNNRPEKPRSPHHIRQLNTYMYAQHRNGLDNVVISSHMSQNFVRRSGLA